MIRSCLAAITCVVLMQSTVDAQDFASAAPRWPRGGAGPLLEDGLPPPDVTLDVDATVTRWFGLPSLETRSVAALARMRAVVVGAGLAQTGGPEVGWTAIGIAAGAVSARGGFALRGVAHRDRVTSFAFDGDARTAGGEVGAGAWVATGAAFRVFASAPQLWREGAAPPLGRALEAGFAWQSENVGAWLARSAVAVSSGMGHGEHEAGIALIGGPLAFWCAARDRPLRASLGVSVGVGGVRSSASLDSHPVLAETTRLTVSLERAQP